MSTTEAGILITAILALAAIFVLPKFRQNFKLRIQSLFGIRMDMEASNKSDPAISVEDATSSEGGFTAQDTTGHGAAIKKLKVKKDISVITKSQDHPDPKAPPR